MTQLTQAEKIGNSVALSPILERNSQIAIQDEDGNEEVADLAELGCNGDQNAASVHIENSNDVHVGNAVTFNAPVTIYQNVQGQINPQLQNEEEETNVTVDSPSKETNKFSSTVSDNAVRKMAFKYLIYAVLTFCIAIVITVVVIFSIGSKTDSKTDPDDEGIDLNKKWLLSKEDWHAKPPSYATRPLKPPVDYVIISHTVTPMCYTYRACSERIRNIQSHHMNGGKSPDIGYNFIIGADGHVYEGRGWDTRNFHTDNSIGICLIGDFTTDKPTDNMMENVKTLINSGVANNKLSIKYTILAHNQTFATDSPGENVYKIIKTWPHFDSEARLN